MLLKLTVVLDYHNAIETYSRIGKQQCYGNLQLYWTTEFRYVDFALVWFCTNISIRLFFV